jgi:hypothetical protein
MGAFSGNQARVSEIFGVSCHRSALRCADTLTLFARVRAVVGAGEYFCGGKRRIGRVFMAKRKKR